MSFKEYCENMAYYHSLGNTPFHLIAKNEDFWKQLANLANSAPQDIAHFLDVPVSSVLRWNGKIQEHIKKSHQQKSLEKKTEMVPTGNPMSGD